MKNAAIILMWLVARCISAAAGTIEDFQFYSESLGEERSIRVYLPENYDPDSISGYPVIYYLHGADSDQTSKPAMFDTLDAMISAGRIQPVIMVKPNGSGCPWGGGITGCGWVNSELQNRFEDYVVEDIVAEAEDRYNIDPIPGRRAIMGLSMGGFGAMHTALKHPGNYRAVVSHSGYLYFDDFLEYYVPAMWDQQDGPFPWEWHPSMGGATLVCFFLSGAFSPNLDNWPYYVDFLLDAYGELVEETWLRWKEHDPAVLAGAISPMTAPAIYFDCGTLDFLLFHAFNVSFHEHLNSLEIVHDWRSFDGNHADRFYERIPVSFTFIDSAFNDLTGVGEAVPIRRESLMAFPNPLNPQMTITFSLERDERADVGVYELTGRRVTVLANREFGAGDHSVVWNGRDYQGRAMPSGTYLVRLETESGVEARKVVLLR